MKKVVSMSAEKKSIAKNYIYNLLFQILSILTPVITVPYVSRILGAEGVGTAAFTDSITQFFVFIAALGITNHGNRCISYVRDNYTERSKVFWEIFILKIFTSILAILFFSIFIVFAGKKYFLIYMIQGIQIIGMFIDISWFFMGLEDFKKTVTRNTVVKIVGLILIFTFVKESSDVWKYVLIIVSSIFIGNLTLWSYVPKYAKFIKPDMKGILSHVKPGCIIFINHITILTYAMFDKTILGIFSNNTEVGIYDASMRMVKLILLIVTSQGLVMMPRISNTYAQGNIAKIREYNSLSLNCVSFLAFPLCFGILGIAGNFIPFFLGKSFLKATDVISILAFLLLVMSWGNVFCFQTLLSIKKDKERLFCAISGSIVGLSSNFILAPKFGAIGTAISAVLAESSVTTVGFFFSRSFINLKSFLKEAWKYWVSALLMYFVIKLTGNIIHNNISALIIQIITGASVYVALTYIFKSMVYDIFFAKLMNLFNKLRSQKSLEETVIE